MNKTISLLFVVISLSILLLLPSLGQSEPKVYVNGKQISTSTVLHDGILYVPAQSIAIALGISIKWNASTQTLYVNDKVTDIKALVISNSVNVPIEALSGNIGATVEWDGRENAVKIITSGTTIASNDNTKPTPTPKPIATPAAPTPTPRPTNPPTPMVVVTKPTVATKPTPHTVVTAPTDSIFIPKTVSNENFNVTITNLEFQSIIKNYYTPKAGYRFCILNVSQQNISANVQIYTGTFSLFDRDGHSYDYLEGLSNFWLQVLQPGGTNFGHLVYEIPTDAVPEKLVLYSVNNPSLTINLY